MNKTDEQQKGTEPASPAAKRIVMFLWHELGQPAIWTFLMLVVFALEVINGFSLTGGFWLVVCLLASFLSRISVAVEKVAERLTET